MQQATPTPARIGGITPSRLCASGGGGGGGGGSGGAAGGGGGGSGVTSADSRPLELIKACVVAVTGEEKMCLESHGASSSDVGNSGAGGGPCAMTMATPTLVRGASGLTPMHGGGSLAGGSVGGVGGGGPGLLGRVEDGLTAFLVLAMGVLRCEDRLHLFVYLSVLGLLCFCFCVCLGWGGVLCFVFGCWFWLFLAFWCL